MVGPAHFLIGSSTTLGTLSDERNLSGLREGRLSQYLAYIGFALFAFIAILIAYYLFFKPSIQFGARHFKRNTYVGDSDLEHRLNNLRRELERSIQTSQEDAKKAARIGEKVIAVLTQIDEALRSMHSRIAQVEGRTGATDALSTDFNPLFRAHEEEHARTSALTNARLAGFEHQLILVSQQISAFNRLMEEMAAQVSENSAGLRTVNAGLAAAESRTDTLSQSVELGKRDFKDLSTTAQLMMESIAGLKSLSQRLGEQCTDFERRFSSKHAESEATPGATSTTIKTVTLEYAKNDHEIGSPQAEGQTIIGDVVRHSHDEDVGTSELSDQPTTLKNNPIEEKVQFERTCVPFASPKNHGGGGRGREAAAQPEPNVVKAPRPKLHLIATCRSGAWDFFAEVEGIDSLEMRLMQGSDCFEPVGTASPFQFGPLRDLITPLRLISEEKVLIEKSLLTPESPLFFQMHGDHARSVIHPTRGLNFAVTPSHWKYDEDVSNAPPVEPEPCAIEGYRTHFFSIEGNPILVFQRSGATPVRFFWSRPEFRLEGSYLDDVEEGMGRLFVGDPPVLDGDANAMATVEKIVLGEEGIGEGRWRKECARAAIDKNTWSFSDDIKAKGSGWYFIRMYGANYQLIDSFPFRYAAGLMGIDVATPQIKESPDKDRVFVRFTHDEATSLRATGVIPHGLQQSITRKPFETVFTWPCDANVRQASFEFQDFGRPVRITLGTDRVWWRLVDRSDTSESSWTACPISIKPNDCSPVSEMKLLIRFPIFSKVDAFVGFRGDNRRAIRISSEGQATVHLHEFSESAERNQFGAHRLKVWVCGREGETEICIANLDVPRQCPWCEIWLVDQEEMLDHLVRRHHEHYFQRLELRGEGVSGPNAIFVCLVSDCGQYYPESHLPGEYPVDRLARHSNEQHPTRMAYRKIDSPEDIKKLLGFKEKWIWKCNLGTCRPITPSVADEDAFFDKKAHLREEHFNDLHRCSGTEN
jgi:hypothetical protein